jgi:hypothetical protein
VNAELAEVFRAGARERVMLPVAPEVLDRIRFVRVAGEPFDHQAIALGIDGLPHEAASMGRKAVPDHEELPGDVPEEVFEKRDDLGSLDRTGEEAEDEVPDRDPGDSGEQVPVEVELEDVRPTSWRLGTAAAGSPAQPALVEEDDRPARTERPRLKTEGTARARWRYVCADRWARIFLESGRAWNGVQD